MYAFITNNFMGTNITVTLVDGTAYTGEVTGLPGGPNMIGLRDTGTTIITFVNANNIISVA